MLATSTSPVASKIGLSFVLIGIILSATHLYRPTNPATEAAKALGRYIKIGKTSLADASELDRVTNQTLGFEKVYVISLPERSDKRDALTLISSLLGFSIEWVDGVKGETVSDKAVPFGTDRKFLWESNLGSWRGHMNAIRGIIENNVSTALLMEDDMDFDVRLKEQLQLFALGSRFVQSTPTSNDPVSPYGDDWDLLWLGHCGEVFPEELPEHKSQPPNDPEILTMSRKYAIRSDPTVPPPDKVTGLQDFTSFPYTRWVHQSGGPICTFAYAVSNRGARKILYDLSVDHLLGPFDNALANLCRYGKSPNLLGMECVSSTPPLFFHHKAKGDGRGDSDIQSVAQGEVRDRGFTENIVWSARANVRQLLVGGQQFETQYPLDMEKEVPQRGSGA